jgi:hypothetical protein
MTEMHKGLFDKLFFADKIDAQTIMDYGCADGALARAHHALFPTINYIGYDSDNEMVKEARYKTAVGHPIRFHNDKVKARSDVARSDGPWALVLSSVLHEVYSYKSAEEISLFHDFCYGNWFDYVVVRDMMMMSPKMYGESDPEQVARVKQVLPAKQLMQWEQQWGFIDDNISLTHLLMTYRYKENWERELKEDYFALGIDPYLQSVPANYEPIHFKHYALPFNRYKIQQDFGFDFNVPTHVQIIFKRNDP